MPPYLAPNEQKWRVRALAHRVEAGIRAGCLDLMRRRESFGRVMARRDSRLGHSSPTSGEIGFMSPLQSVVWHRAVRIGYYGDVKPRRTTMNKMMILCSTRNPEKTLERVVAAASPEGRHEKSTHANTPHTTVSGWGFFGLKDCIALISMADDLEQRSRVINNLARIGGFSSSRSYTANTYALCMIPKPVVAAFQYQMEGTVESIRQGFTRRWGRPSSRDGARRRGHQRRPIRFVTGNRKDSALALGGIFLFRRRRRRRIACRFQRTRRQTPGLLFALGKG